MSVRRAIRMRLYAEDWPLILKSLEDKGCAYRFNSKIAGFDRIFDLAVMVRGRYCVGLARARQRGESFFETYCHPRFMNGWEMKRWKRDFEAQIKAIQIKEKLARNGYILTGFEEKDERIVLRIKQAV